MNLSDTPHGYKHIVPLDKTFRLRLPEAGEAPRFCHTLHAIPISASEFPAAMRDYPIVFVRRAGELLRSVARPSAECVARRVKKT